MQCQPNYQSFCFSFFRNTWEEFEERLRHRERAEAALNKQYCGNLRVTWWNFAVLFCAFCLNLCSHLYVWFFNQKTPRNQCQLFFGWRLLKGTEHDILATYMLCNVFKVWISYHTLYDAVLPCYRSYLVTTFSHPGPRWSLPLARCVATFLPLSVP